MTRRASVLAAVAAAALTLAALTGCTPAPAPRPTPTIASDEEAFAAAEATYRAYVDALNHVDLADPATFEPVYAWTTGDANTEARESFSQMHADGWTVAGTSAFDGFQLSEVLGGVVDVSVCLDVTDVDVRDANGVSVVGAERRDRQPVTVEFEPASTSTGLIVSASKATNEDDVCA